MINQKKIYLDEFSAWNKKKLYFSHSHAEIAEMWSEYCDVQVHDLFIVFVIEIGVNDSIQFSIETKYL